MEKHLLKEIIEKKEKKIEFAIVTNLKNGESCLFEKNKSISKNFEKHKEKINFHFDKKKNGIVEETNIFIETYIRPIKVIIVGAVHIAQYLVSFAKSLNKLRKKIAARHHAWNFFKKFGPKEQKFWADHPIHKK